MGNEVGKADASPFHGEISFKSTRDSPKTGIWPFQTAVYTVSMVRSGWQEEILTGRFRNHHQAEKAARKLVKEMRRQVEA